MAQRPLATEARGLVLAGDREGARQLVVQLVAEVTGREVTALSINTDQYSLNSVNGRAELDGGERYFFKFHSEEGEESTIAEYYNAELLRDAGYLVDVPSFANGEPGRQILLYRLRDELRLADVARAVELDLPGAEDAAAVVAAQRERDRRNGRILLSSLHEAAPEAMMAEPIHQLFSHRLQSEGAAPGRGGRVASFYVGQEFQLGDVSLGWDELAALRWRINGTEYGQTLGQLFDEAGARMQPDRLTSSGAVVAHGDDHNANIWYSPVPEGAADLIAFDPAFAGRHLPSLLAEIKATFHNSLAHPLWLYEPGLATERYSASVAVRDGMLAVEHDWEPSPLRREFLRSRAEEVWKPLLAELDSRGWLPADWRRVIRLGLFLCPTVVLNLRAGTRNGHTPVTSAIGLGLAVACGAEPVVGTDLVREFIDSIAP